MSMPDAKEFELFMDLCGKTRYFLADLVLTQCPKEWSVDKKHTMAFKIVYELACIYSVMDDPAEEDE